MPVKANPVSARAEVAIPLAPARVSYRVLPKGAGLVHSGEYDPVSGASLTFAKGDVVEGADPATADQLEARGLVEVLGAA